MSNAPVVLMRVLCVPQGFRGTVSPAQHECSSDTENNNNIKKVRARHHLCHCKHSFVILRYANSF